MAKKVRPRRYRIFYVSSDKWGREIRSVGHGTCYLRSRRFKKVGSNAWYRQEDGCIARIRQKAEARRGS